MSNKDTSNNDNYFVIIEQLFNIMKSSTETNISDIINVILENCHLITLSTFEKIDKHNNFCAAITFRRETHGRCHFER